MRWPDSVVDWITQRATKWFWPVFLLHPDSAQLSTQDESYFWHQIFFFFVHRMDIRLKIHYHDEARRFALPSNQSALSDLVHSIREFWPVADAFKLTYVDDEGDSVPFHSDAVSVVSVNHMRVRERERNVNMLSG